MWTALGRERSDGVVHVVSSAQLLARCNIRLLRSTVLFLPPAAGDDYVRSSVWKSFISDHLFCIPAVSGARFIISLAARVGVHPSVRRQYVIARFVQGARPAHEGLDAAATVSARRVGERYYRIEFRGWGDW